MTKEKKQQPRKRPATPVFNKETLRKLTSTDLARVGGGDEDEKSLCSRMSCCDDCPF